MTMSTLRLVGLALLLFVTACAGKDATEILDRSQAVAQACVDRAAAATGLPPDQVSASYEGRDSQGRQTYVVLTPERSFRCAVGDDAVVTAFGPMG